uniref:Uncharacterized protein n=1 Tax=Anguilla anguilla TaxID=7936 RepID=A0A0E9QNE8_ANGAN
MSVCKLATQVGFCSGFLCFSYR